MTIETNDVASRGSLSPEEDRFWDKVGAAWRDEGEPTADEICRLARDEHGFDLSPGTVQGWLDQERVPRLFGRKGPQPFAIFLKVLRVREPIQDWVGWAREAQHAKVRRLKAEDTRLAKAETLATSAEPVVEGVLDLDPPQETDDQPDPLAPLLVPEAPEEAAIPAPGPDDAPASPELGRRSTPPPPPTPARSPILAVVLGILLAGAGATAVVSPGGQESIVGPSDSFEGRVDGTQAGVQDPLAETIGVWSRPGTTNGCNYSPCIHPDSNEIGEVKHGQVVKVDCVTTGQRLRNGVKGAPGYHDDDRWVKLAPGQGISGSGYLSNTYFARNSLPTNLARCSR